jgi:hypothetical protein
MAITSKSRRCLIRQIAERPGRSKSGAVRKRSATVDGSADTMALTPRVVPLRPGDLRMRCRCVDEAHAGASDREGAPDARAQIPHADNKAISSVRTARVGAQGGD